MIKSFLEWRRGHSVGTQIVIAFVLNMIFALFLLFVIGLLLSQQIDTIQFYLLESLPFALVVTFATNRKSIKNLYRRK